jgi:hypothetical protein
VACCAVTSILIDIAAENYPERSTSNMGILGFMGDPEIKRYGNPPLRKGIHNPQCCGAELVSCFVGVNNRNHCISPGV